jgi:hypothetical protein
VDKLWGDVYSYPQLYFYTQNPRNKLDKMCTNSLVIHKIIRLIHHPFAIVWKSLENRLLCQKKVVHIKKFGCGKIA